MVGIEGRGDAESVRRCSAIFGVHVGQPSLHQLIVGDGLAKLGPTVCVRENKGKYGSHDPKRESVSQNSFSASRWISDPKGPALRTSRSISNPSMRTLTPSFKLPSMFSFGTNTSSKTNSPVFEPRMPSLSSLRLHETPVEALSSTKAVIPRLPLPGSVLA